MMGVGVVYDLEYVNVDDWCVSLNNLMWSFWYEILMIKIMTSIEWYCLWIWYGWKVLILLVVWMIDEMWIDVFWCVISLLNMMFFGWVREKPYFIRAERCFECIFDDF